MLAPALSLLLAGQALALSTRQSCPPLQVFGARETTAPAGYGTSQGAVNRVVQAHPGAASSAIVYPACGGQAQCGGLQYGDSVKAGTAAVAKAVNDFHTKCPESQIVLIGYSQGGQIIDNAICGGGDTHSGIADTAIPISESAQAMVKAAIFMGDPRHIPDLPYNVGTCKASGFAPRPTGFVCPNADKVKSYCDAQDPYCCNGNDANHHQQYVNIYGNEIFAFIEEHLSP